jgi:hypothetical protein
MNIKRNETTKYYKYYSDTRIRLINHTRWYKEHTCFRHGFLHQRMNANGSDTK